MDIKYLLSNHIDYNLLICADAGPGYAKSMGWECSYLNNPFITNEETIIIVDNRIQPNELESLNQLILNYSNNKFFLKIVDPYIDNENHYYYKFLFNASIHKNTYLLSVYAPKEITNQLKTEFGNRFIHIPYPYLKEREIDVKNKKNKIIISGSLNQPIYPYRYSIWQKTTRSLSRFVFFHILKHPGYAEMNSSKKHAHSLINDEYVSYLSKFKFMFLCPSRCYIEFLKFHECAYAGCIPVGLAPDLYPAHIQRLFLPLRINHFISDIIKLIFKRNTFNTVTEFRKFLNETRNPICLNNMLELYINENTFHTT